MTEYDKENVFAKILERKLPCHKVYETRCSLAILDLHPVCTGHVLLVSKFKGATDFLSMPPNKAAEFAADLHKVSNAVKTAFGAEAVNIFNNSGAASGQEVFHPHFHIIPRFGKDDKHAPKIPAGAKDALSAEDAAPVLEKLNNVLYPPKPLKKPKFQSIGKISTTSKGMNLLVKVISDAEKVDNSSAATNSKSDREATVFYEAKVGDSTGTVTLSLREDQKACIKVGDILEVRNCATKMVKGHIRIAIDKWGKIEKSDETFEGDVDEAKEKDVSTVEYELVKPPN